MTLAQRIRDYRYAKGWGPDELASRAAISRTALYQIESGKTELPRAGTLRRIALALEIPVEDLLGPGSAVPEWAGAFPAPERNRGAGREMAPAPWYPTEGAPLNLPSSCPVPAEDREGARFALEPSVLGAPADEWLSSTREHELTVKLHHLLTSPLGEGVARILEEAYRLLSYARASGDFPGKLGSRKS